MLSSELPCSSHLGSRMWFVSASENQPVVIMPVDFLASLMTGAVPRAHMSRDLSAQAARIVCGQFLPPYLL